MIRWIKDYKKRKAIKRLEKAKFNEEWKFPVFSLFDGAEVTRGNCRACGFEFSIHVLHHINQKYWVCVYCKHTIVSKHIESWEGKKLLE